MTENVELILESPVIKNKRNKRIKENTTSSKEKRIENTLWMYFSDSWLDTTQCVQGDLEHDSMFRSVPVQTCKRGENPPFISSSVIFIIFQSIIGSNMRWSHSKGAGILNWAGETDQMIWAHPGLQIQSCSSGALAPIICSVNRVNSWIHVLIRISARHFTFTHLQNTYSTAAFGQKAESTLDIAELIYLKKKKKKRIIIIVVVIMDLGSGPWF